MKRNTFYIFLTIIFFIFLILPVTAAADDTPQLPQLQANQSSVTFGLRITGGCFPLMRNDINDHLQSYNDYYNDTTVTVGSEFEMIKMGMDFSGEILVSFMPNFSIGIGAGYISAGKETTLELSDTMYSADYTYNPKFSVIPITLSLYYEIPIGSSIQVVLNAGLGYYLGTVNFDHIYFGDVGSYTYEESYIWSARSNAMGFHGGIDLELGIARNVALVVGAKGRYAKLTDLTGDEDYEYTTSFGYSSSSTYEDMTLWYYIYDEELPLAELWENKPTGMYVSDARKAEVNLSGLTFLAGIKISF
jgi:hypothetical protein